MLHGGLVVGAHTNALHAVAILVVGDLVGTHLGLLDLLSAGQILTTAHVHLVGIVGTIHGAMQAGTFNQGLAIAIGMPDLAIVDDVVVVEDAATYDLAILHGAELAANAIIDPGIAGFVGIQVDASLGFLQLLVSLLDSQLPIAIVTQDIQYGLSMVAFILSKNRNPFCKEFSC